MAAPHTDSLDGPANCVHATQDGDRLDWRQVLTAPNTPLRNLLASIRKTGLAIVVDCGQRLLGTVSDADVRRALLRGARLDEPVRSFMAATPAPQPILDADQRVVGMRAAAARTLADRLAVVVAGGEGRRLRPATELCPKPLLQVGGRPLLELTLESLRDHGYSRFVFCLRYLADMIERHFGDGRQFGVRIQYVRDRARLGTAGPLGLLGTYPAGPVLVINGDILTSVDFSGLMAFHEDSGAAATMCVCEVAAEVPYGIVSVADGRVESIREKPVGRWLVNAGIYVLEPHALDQLPRDRAIDMPEFFNELARRGNRIAPFPIHEQWLDIGTPRDLAYARALARVAPPAARSLQARPHARQSLKFVVNNL